MRTLVLFKPDALQRGLVGSVMARFERKGLKLVGLKLVRLDEASVRELYPHLVEKPFFPEIVEFMTSAPVVASVWEGPESVSTVRSLCGPTNGREAPPGTVRGDFSSSVMCNLVHASESPEAAEREIRIFFDESEIVSWERDLEKSLLSLRERPKSL